jgi:AcrR family transcriptional regulator
MACEADKRVEARQLRNATALSIRAIAARLGASPSSVYHWTRDIELSPEKRAAIRRSRAVQRAQATGNEAMRALARQKRLEGQDRGRGLARECDPLHVSGCMLYWAEGSKARNDVRFTNSDPDMMWTFVEFLRSCYGVRPDDIRLTVNVHLNNGLTLPEIEEWWLSRLNLSPRSLGSHTVNRYSKASKRRRRTLPYGTARIIVHSTFIVQSIYGAIQEYAGINRPEWVDL